MCMTKLTPEEIKCALNWEEEIGVNNLTQILYSEEWKETDIDVYVDGKGNYTVIKKDIK